LTIGLVIFCFQTYDEIRGQITSDDFLGYLGEIKNLTDFASGDSADLASSSAAIQSFADSIVSTTDKQEVWKKQGDLIEALEKVTFTLDCYYKKVKTFQVIESRCSEGLDTLENVYNTAVAEFDTNDNDCTYNVSKTNTGNCYFITPTFFELEMSYIGICRSHSILRISDFLVLYVGLETYVTCACLSEYK